MKKTLAIVLALVLAMSMLAGCSTEESTDQGNDSSETISITDMAGREVTLDAAAQRVVAVTASDCEILYAIGAGETLVGRGEYCDYPDEISDVQVVESAEALNTEELIALEPDVVIVSTMLQNEEQVNTLAEAGITVLVSDAQTIDDVYVCIEMIGKAVGKNDEAASLIESMKSRFDEISENKLDGGSIYFEVSPLEYGLWTAGSGTFMDEIATMLGLENAFGDVSGWAEISEEQVIERNPDYIVTITMYYGEGETPVEEILGREGWQEINAVKNGAVFNIDSNEVSRPGPRLADGAKAIYDEISALTANAAA